MVRAVVVEKPSLSEAMVVSMKHVLVPNILVNPNHQYRMSLDTFPGVHLGENQTMKVHAQHLFLHYVLRSVFDRDHTIFGDCFFLFCVDTVVVILRTVAKIFLVRCTHIK